MRIYIYMHIHIYICVCLSIYIYIYIYIYNCKCVGLYIHIHVYTNIYRDTYICIYTYICTYVYVYIYIYMYTYIYTYIHTYIYIYMCFSVLQCDVVSSSVIKCLAVRSSMRDIYTTFHPSVPAFFEREHIFQREDIFLSPTTMRDIYTTFHPSVPAFFEREHIFLSPTTAQQRRMWRPTPTHIGLFFLIEKISLFEDNVCLFYLQQRSGVAYGGPHPHL